MRGDLELAIFTGLQGSGKTTFYRERLAPSHLHVSKDSFPSARDKERRQRELVTRALAEGRSVAVDNTNATPAARAPLIALGRSWGARVVGFVFEADVASCVERNRRRKGRGRVPDVAIYATAKRLVPPALEEGYDAIYRVRLQGDGFEVRPIR